mmetsp:Transcript_51817/g.58761  ORF Transcript_51817/g.58761 Transcript_51817/m.58761 type:complete len:164 (-) Transcript_51817:99-590(-)
MTSPVQSITDKTAAHTEVAIFWKPAMYWILSVSLFSLWRRFLLQSSPFFASEKEERRTLLLASSFEASFLERIFAKDKVVGEKPENPSQGVDKYTIANSTKAAAKRKVTTIVSVIMLYSMISRLASLKNCRCLLDYNNNNFKFPLELKQRLETETFAHSSCLT